MESEKNICPIVSIDGEIACGKQYDLNITLPCDNRDVIYGIVKDCYNEPIKDAVVKLIEVVCEKGDEKRKPVGHTFTDCEGEFVFGPLCPDRNYEIQLWVNRIRHLNVCAKCQHQGKCLKGVDMDCCDVSVDCACKEICKTCKKECNNGCMCQKHDGMKK